MRRVWLVYNNASGSVTDKTIAAIDAAFELAGWTCTGRSGFPAEAIPEVADLADHDMVVVAAGDGTINAVARALEDWPGTLLVLPGGTMNMLPKALHGTRTSDEIIALAGEADASPMPVVRAGDHHALVAVLAGPAARWVHAREAVRKGRWRRLTTLTRLGWLRSFHRAIRFVDGNRRSPGYRALSLSPEHDALHIVAVTARDWRDAATLGWHWLKGTVEDAAGVRVLRSPELRLASSRPVFALFDGEPATLPPDMRFEIGETRLRFVRTA